MPCTNAEALARLMEHYDRMPHYAGHPDPGFEGLMRTMTEVRYRTVLEALAESGLFVHAQREPEQANGALFYGRTWQFEDAMEAQHSFLPHVSVYVPPGTEIVVLRDEPGKQYAARMASPLVLTAEDQDRVAALMDDVRDRTADNPPDMAGELDKPRDGRPWVSVTCAKADWGYGQQMHRECCNCNCECPCHSRPTANADCP